MTPQSKAEYDVFLSYSREDEPRVAAMHDALSGMRLSVWRDTGQIVAGDSFIGRIENGLGCSRCVVVFCSGAALASKWVQREWNVALTLNTRIIPVRLDDSELPLMLRMLDFVDLRDPRRLDQAVREIAEAVSGQPLPAPTPAAPAVASNPSVLGRDVVVIDRIITREERNAASIARARLAAVVLGLILAGASGIFAPAGLTIALGGACVLIAGALVVAFTAKLNAVRTEARRLSSIKDGIELYCPGQPACIDFRIRLENILKQAAGMKESA
jgi:hypothetical protein